MFITFEGPDGAGKSTQIKLFCEFLANQKIPYVLTREPGGTPLAEMFRDQVKHYHGEEPITIATELLLFAASRSQHVQHFIRPQLEKGNFVICDRFSDSTVAYQGYGRGIDYDFITKLNAFVMDGIKPDITILLDLNPEIGLARVANRETTDRIEMENLTFHQKVRNGFLSIAKESPQRFIVVDASLPLEFIHQNIISQFSSKIKHPSIKTSYDN